MATNKPKLSAQGNKLMRAFEKAVEYYAFRGTLEPEGVHQAAESYKQADKALRNYIHSLETGESSEVDDAPMIRNIRKVVREEILRSMI